MHTTGSILRVIGCLTILLTALAIGPISIPATAEQPGSDQNDQQDIVIIHLLSGRTMKANIDARTDTGQLWLRWDSPGAEVLRPIEWDRIAEAEIKGNTISGKDLLGLVDQIRREFPAQPISAPPAKHIVMLGSPADRSIKTSGFKKHA